MELSLIEYLEEKNFDVDQIIRIQKRLISKKTEDVIKKFNAVYKIFGYAGLPELSVNSLIYNNIKLLEKPDLEIIKIAFCWINTSLLSEAALRKEGINYQNATRSYLRNVYLNSGINIYKSPISYEALTMGDSEFSSDHIGTLNRKPFYPNFENLVVLYGKGKTYEEKRKYIEDYIINCPLNWYISCLKKEKEKKHGSKSL